uniref:S1 motif domain-containing protein n=1 Tax=viral metagenome TaxID=1070528 RepID=A0A6C0JU98_9ZZZZ
MSTTSVVQSANKADMLRRKQIRGNQIFSQAIIHHRLSLSIVYIDGNIKQTLQDKIEFDIGGKCIVDGFVKTGSCKVLSYSCGRLQGSDVTFDVVLECLICCPVEGMIIDCVAKFITETAGIKAELESSPSPLILYIARDHHYKHAEFNNVRIGDKLKAKIIGQRYELNDTYISIIAELVSYTSSEVKQTQFTIKKSQLKP